MKTMTSITDLFHPLIKKWFLDSFSNPTDIQELAWPLIANKKNVLITAPTGSGKTLTAFLWFINLFVTKNLPTGLTRVLYVSPLKALNNDIQRNLNQPLREIKSIFETNEEPFPDIRVMTRSGDTSQGDRRKMIRHPPEILITTPESLNILLSSKSGKEMLYNISAVILDEVHAVVGNKRGVHLITAVDRLVSLSGEFQRISLSATIKKLDMVAKFVGGYRMHENGAHPRYIARPVEIVKSNIQKNYKICVKFPERAEEPVDTSVWDSLAKEFKDRVEKNRSTLLFTNGRRLCEKITYKINKLSGSPLAYSHHGSLSKQLRENVEQNLKNGELKAIVATSSLEMGIDIGDLDEVILIQSPPSVSSAVQRIGRAGHHVNMESRGTLYSANPQDLIPSAVLAKAIDDQDIEPLHPIQCPLDVLAQILISMTGLETWDMDELYNFLKTSYPYRNLARKQYDLVLNMLAGRYSDTRIRELKPRISIDRLDNTVQGKKGALLALYTSGGTIPDRGYFQLRHHETRARIGELDEEYVWEAKIGQIATLGTQNWKIMQITHNDVLVVPVGNRLMEAPFWIGEGINRDYHFSRLILLFLERIDGQLKQPDFDKVLEKEFHLDTAAAKELIRFLKRQKKVTASDLPHRHHILLEYVRSGPDGSPGSMLVIHTLWGGQLNRPYSLALEAAWEQHFGEKPEIFPGNDAIVIQLPHKIEPEEILSLVTSANVETLLKKQLEKTGFFSARFRECSGRALLVIKNKINHRMPLWMTRLKSKKLLENILGYEDFPILLETWRTCLQDEFNLKQLQSNLDQLESSAIAWTASFTDRPSPFAASMAWNQINQYMYQEDQGASSTSSLGTDLIKDVVFSENLRPAISLALIKEFEIKCRRLAPGYAPQSPRDLIDWVKERIAIPYCEWKVLLEQIELENPKAFEQIKDLALIKLVCITHENLDEPLVISLELISKITTAWYGSKQNILLKNLSGDPLTEKIPVHTKHHGEEQENDFSLLGQWLQFYGPRNIDFIKTTLGIENKHLGLLLNYLIESRQVISGKLVKNGYDHDVCDSENFEILLRLSRSRAIPRFQALDIQYLPLFIANYQGLLKKQDSIDDLFERIEQLICLPLAAEAWELDVLPARIRPYHNSFLDTIMQEGDLQWLGHEKKKVTFCFKSDLDFFQHPLESKLKSHSEKKQDKDDSDLENIFKDTRARYDFAGLLGMAGCDSSKLSEKIWDMVWNTKLSNETFSALRKGIETGFKAPEISNTGTPSRFGRRQTRGKKSFTQWRGSLPFAGHWFKPDIPDDSMDFIEIEELNKDRVRLLLDRYGILFRELVLRELPQFKWQSIFRSLRLMELAGEILAGFFFKDIPGPQFISQKAFRKLQVKLPKDVIYFMNAADPASLCGIPIAPLKQSLPKRLSNTHLVFKGKDLKLVSMKNGKELLIHANPDDEHLIEYLAPLKHLLNRQFKPLKKIVIEKINGESAEKNPYVNAFKTVFNVLVEYKKVILYRKMDFE